MRRVMGLVLAGLGAALIVVAVFLPTYVTGQVIKYPLNEYLKTNLQGTNVSYFSPSLIEPITGATMVVTSTVKGDAAAGTSSTAVWNGFTYLYDSTNREQFQYSARRFAFDRRTAQLVNCCGANVNGNTGIRQTGLVGFLWPFGTKPQTYQVFDPAANRAEPARYTGTAAIGGISVDRFVEHVTHLRIGSQALPASLVHLPGNGTVTLPEYYTGTVTYWVDPKTGAQLDTTEAQRVTLEDSAGTTRLVVLNGTLKFTPASVNTVVGLDRTARGELQLVEFILPLVLGLVGLAALVTGIVLTVLRRDDQPDRARNKVTEPALGPVR
jgi:Porin PorA